MKDSIFLASPITSAKTDFRFGFSKACGKMPTDSRKLFHLLAEEQRFQGQRARAVRPEENVMRTGSFDGTTTHQADYYKKQVVSNSIFYVHAQS